MTPCSWSRRLPDPLYPGQGFNAVIIVDIVRGRSGAPQPGGEVKVPSFLLQAAHGEAGHTCPGLSFWATSFSSSRWCWSFTARVGQYILVVEQGQAVKRQREGRKACRPAGRSSAAPHITGRSIPIADLVALISAKIPMAA